MTIFNTKLTLWAGLSALIMSIMACQTTGGPASAMSVDRPCPVIQSQNASTDRFINIEYDQNSNSPYVPIKEKLKYFGKGNALIWKADMNHIEQYAIDFDADVPGCTTNASAPKKWPCEDNPGGWEDGKSEANGNQPLVCRTRNNAIPGGQNNVWDYCYTIRAKTASGWETVDPVGGGNGCSGCHADTSF